MDLNETRNNHVHFYPYNYNQNQNQNQNPNVNPNVNPRQRSQQSGRQYPTQYKWEMSQWSDCNGLCDGEQFRTAACVQIDAGRHVSPSSCREPKPEDEYQVCNAGCVVELVLFFFVCHQNVDIMKLMLMTESNDSKVQSK